MLIAARRETTAGTEEVRLCHVGEDQCDSETFCTAAPARVGDKTPIHYRWERIREMPRPFENPINPLRALPASLCRRSLCASRFSLCSPGGAGLSSNPEVCAAAFQKEHSGCRHLTSLFHALTFLFSHLALHSQSSPGFALLPQHCWQP